MNYRFWPTAYFSTLMIILLVYVEAHIFILETLEKLGICYCIMLVLLLFMQAGFRPGKSCISQLLNLTQHIEDGYQNRMITAAAFVDLSAAYDTVNHRILIPKIFNTTRDSPLCRVIQNMLSSRKLYVELNNQRSRWRKQHNGLPRGSVLTSIV